MKVQLHHGIMMSQPWRTHDVPEATSLGEAAYLAAKRAVGVKDDEHTYQVQFDIPLMWGGELTHFNSVRFYRNEKSERLYPFNGPESYRTDYWFAFQFREVPTNEKL